MNEKTLTRYLYNPAVIAILLISYKWITSFYFYSEDIDLRIIKERRFYDEHGTKKFALLEEGQTVKIDSHPRSGSGALLCRVVNPSEVSKDFGVRDGMLVEVDWEDLGFEE